MNAEARTVARNGHLVIIGGGEDRSEDKAILDRFVQLAGGPGARIAVITAASRIADEMWAIYDRAFGELGVAHRRHVNIATREQANASACADQLEQADGIFMTGGDQKRLLATLGGTSLDIAIHSAYRQRGACIGGTSAGASAMSGHMLAQGKAELQPEKGAVSLGAGLGLVQHTVIDQHFSQRHRLSRLLTVVAQNPYLHGVGIDEDTALVVEHGVGIEVIGQGAVTIVDGRHMLSNLADVPDRCCPEMIDVRLHLLPAGSRYTLDQAHPAPAPLQDILNNISKRKPFT